MAIRKSNILGPVSGKHGNTVTRIRYGKEVLYALPDKVKVSQSKEAKAARKKFGMTVSFAKFINSIPALSSIWSAAKIPGTNSYQKLIKHNSKLTGEDNLTINNIITPEGFFITINDFSFSSSIIRLSIDFSRNNIQSTISFPLLIHAVLYVYVPWKENDKPFQLLALSQELTQVEFDNKSIIQLELSPHQKIIAESYNKCISYFAITSSIENSNKPIWSTTTARLIELE